MVIDSVFAGAGESLALGSSTSESSEISPSSFSESSSFGIDSLLVSTSFVGFTIPKFSSKRSLCSFCSIRGVSERLAHFYT